MGLGAARGVRHPGRWPRHVDGGALCTDPPPAKPDPSRSGRLSLVRRSRRTRPSTAPRLESSEDNAHRKERAPFTDTWS